MPLSRAAFRPTLRQTMGLLLAGAILLSAGIITTHSYVSSRRTLLAISRSLIEQDAVLVREQVRLFFDGLRATAEQARSELEEGIVRAEEPRALEAYLFQVLRAHPSMSKIGYGDEGGGFLMVTRQPDGSLATKVVRRQGDRVSVRWRHRAPGAGLDAIREEREDDQDRYDPRVRPWYAGARAGRRLYFTEAYVFHSDHQPGVTVAGAHRGPGGELRGVLMVDVSIRDLSRFIAQIHVGESGIAFLFDRQGALLAAPGGDATGVSRDAERHGAGPGPGEHPDEGRLRRVSESARADVAALGAEPAFRQALAGGLGGAHTLRYRIGARDHVAHLSPIQIDEGVRWGVGLLANEEEFLADAQRTNVRNLGTALLFAVLAALCGVLVARFIARSLESLVDESARLRQLEFTASKSPLGPFREVHEVLQAFEHMKTGLRAFQKYVPVHLVRSLLSSRNEPGLGGEVRELTLFFSDIRGFTTISETLQPMELAEKLARYLSAVTTHIHRHRGTVDKYMGDAVMAFWGAPQAVEDHALLACRAALRCQADIRALSEQDPKFPNFATRIGLHTADVVVGNFGSLDRLNYTVLGDGVNLASRLEGLNELLGTEILISEDTRRLVGDAMEVRHIGLLPVRGRKGLLGVYELLGERGEVAESRLLPARRYEEALGLYTARRFSEAAERLEALLAAREERAARALLARCRAYEHSPPPPEWDGAMALT